MRWLVLLLLTFGMPSAAFADHITGGEIFYTLLGQSEGVYRYSVTAKVFMRCNSGRQFNNPAFISVFDKANNNRVADQEVNLVRTETIQLADPNRCITDPPRVCYEVGYYEFTVSLPGSASGYQLVSQFVFRISGIRNLVPFYNNVGATYTAEIPPNTGGAAANNSARFVGSDLVAICANNNFSYSFAAQDPDGDELRYSFCEALQGGAFRNGAASAPTTPPYQAVPYNGNFTGGAPLGGNVKINPKTGLITGIAPGEGVYVVTVCVEEVRQGKVIATQRKDLQIFIASCTIASASLLPEYSLCRDSKTLSLSNMSTSPLIRSYNWELLDRGGQVLTQSNTQSLNYTFADTGLYRVKLVVNRGGECADSNLSLVRVYPGLKPAFDYEGVCINRPTRFLSRSTTAYGTISNWQWDFGDNNGTEAATLSVPDPSFQYNSEGNRRVQLTVTTSLGCVDTAIRSVAITGKPLLQLLFRDTTICITDRVQLVAQGSGRYRWSPQAGLQNALSATPAAAPATTTMYVAELDQDGCTNRDSVLVRVENGVRLNTLPDTTICTGDTIRLRTNGNALRYTWQPAPGLFDTETPSPEARPLADTRYTVTGIIGSCTATASVLVRSVAYPQVNAGADTVICFNTSALLSGSTNGNRFAWSEPQTLRQPGALQSPARPVGTTNYVLTAFDGRGCPKPATDTVLVTVRPPVRAYAGRDTVAVTGQPLQLNATGGDVYTWTPSTALSDATVGNPVAVYAESYTGSIRYLVRVATPEGCSDTASVLVRIFATGPTVFVPTAFTPNGDGLNDRLRPVVAGMRMLENFAVFNRWGQQLFSTSDNRGWDGTINGQPQQAGVYIWMVKATDFTGKPYLRKGTVTLLR